MLPTIFFISIFASFGLPELNCPALANAAAVSSIARYLSLQIKHLQISCNARKLSAECIIEMCGQSEDKQADCLNKNATCHTFSKAFLVSFGLPELNRTALANEATVSAHSYDIFILRIKCFEISCNAKKLSAECSLKCAVRAGRDKQADCLSKNASCQYSS